MDRDESIKVEEFRHLKKEIRDSNDYLIKSI
jgi:hypothetical protein